MEGIIKNLYKGFLSINSITFSKITDAITRREWQYMERGDSVSIIVNIKGTDKFVVIQQFRVGPFVREGAIQSYSNPAGMIDDGETPIEAAIRELKEEIGATPLSITSLGKAYPSSGGCTEITYMFYAEVEEQDFTALDIDEGITFKVITDDNYEDMIDSGLISSMQMQNIFYRAKAMGLF
jgi:ADP-ribose pyrophosphatase